MEKLIEETTQRIVNTLQKKISKLEKALGQSQDKEDELTVSEADSSFEDILSVNESNLEKDTPFYLKGYNIYRNDRVGQTGGGVLLAVKENIKSRELINKTIDNKEIVAIEIETKSYGRILIASIYVPPKAKIAPEVFRDLHQINNDCIVMGRPECSVRRDGITENKQEGETTGGHY